MILPQIPTDNLYKFFFVAGLIIIGYLLLLFTNKETEIYESVNEIEMDVLKLRMQNFEDSLTISTAIERLEKEVEFDSIRMDYLDTMIVKNLKITPKELLDLRVNLSESDNSNWLIIEKINKNEVLNKFQSEIISYKVKKVNENVSRLITFGIIFIIGSVVGICMTIYGGYQWYYKIQIPTDLRIKYELEKLRNK